LCRNPFLFNFIVKKANNSAYVRQFLIEALANIEKKASLLDLKFYWRMLFEKGDKEEGRRKKE